MRALVTNDDGVSSAGIRVLAAAAASEGIEVLVAAPSWDSSGASASLTAVERDGAFLFEPTTVDGVDDESYAVQASPAFIARAALSGAFGEPPDLCLSGVNHGLNTGHAILHSGTVGAAATAFSLGVPGLAFSIEAVDAVPWDTAAAIVRRVLRWLRDRDDGILLNVNIPARPVHEVRGLRAADLSSTGSVTATVTEVGEGYVAMEYRAASGPHEPDSDAALVDEGWATFTPLDPVCRAASMRLDGLDHEHVGHEHLGHDHLDLGSISS